MSTDIFPHGINSTHVLIDKINKCMFLYGINGSKWIKNITIMGTKISKANFAFPDT